MGEENEGQTMLIQKDRRKDQREKKKKKGGEIPNTTQVNEKVNRKTEEESA